MESLSADGVGNAPPTAFRNVRWRLSDVLLALAPLAAVRVLVSVVRAGGLPGWPRWAEVGIAVLELRWLVGAPVWLARRRGAAVPRFPRARTLLFELALAIPLLLITWFALGIALAVWQAAA